MWRDRSDNKVDGWMDAERGNWKVEEQMIMRKRLLRGRKKRLD